jgi:uncharacterized protein
VFLAGEYVYKVKKSVRFDFADCSNLAARYELCREEVRLNRRLAPEVYLAVVPIFRDGRRFLLGNDGESFDPGAQEYAVKMRRLPEDRMLDRLLCTGKADIELIDEIVKKLAAFHRSASMVSGWRFGSATAVQRLVLGNLDESHRFIGNTVSAHQFGAIEKYLDGYIAAPRDLLDDRVRQGRVRDGHGDLRCEHICMTNGIQIFDCLEFSERLRCADVAADIAFLAMDFDSLGASRLADDLVRAYTEETDDEKFPTLINFYKSHRACGAEKWKASRVSKLKFPQLNVSKHATLPALILLWRFLMPHAAGPLS